MNGCMWYYDYNSEKQNKKKSACLLAHLLASRKIKNTTTSLDHSPLVSPSKKRNGKREFVHLPNYHPTDLSTSEPPPFMYPPSR